MYEGSAIAIESLDQQSHTRKMVMNAVNAQQILSHYNDVIN